MRILTAGESHGPYLTAIIEGIPSGLTIDIDKINHALFQRQCGYGRGGRMKIEKDQVKITSGVRHQKTLGSPITLMIENRNFKQWHEEMAIEKKYDSKRIIKQPRPGHADLCGGLKRNFSDLRNVLERSSARETAIRVAVGALCEQLLEHLGIACYSRVLSIADISDPTDISDLSVLNTLDSDFRVLSDQVRHLMKCKIDQAKKDGTSLGGTVQTIITGVPAGIGDYTQWDRKLDAKISYAVMSINGFKGVSFGDGFSLTEHEGYKVMDEIKYIDTYRRTSNHLGGIEGGMTTGEPIIINGAMKPIPTQYHPLQTVNIDTKEQTLASVERSDTCAVPAASIVMEYVIATVLTQTILEIFHNDSIEALEHSYNAYKERISNY